MLGDYEDERADFPLLQFLQKEYELIASNASAGAWPEAVKLAVSNQLPLECLVTHTISPADFAEGLRWVDTRRPDVIKVVIDWTG